MMYSHVEKTMIIYFINVPVRE